MSADPVLVLFDCDGTLIDSAGIIIAVMHETFEIHGETQATDAAVRSIIGLSLPVAIAQLLNIEPHSDRALLLTETYKLQFNTFHGRRDLADPMFDGIDGLLRALRTMDAAICGVVTGKSRRGLKIGAELHGFEWLLPISRTADDCPSKPAPDMVSECCRQAGINEPRTLVVGDTSFDMQMAQAAGARAIGVGWGYHDADILTQAGAETVLQHPSDLLPIVQQALNHA
ncbi:MAG: HAD-IA family hydrolase [Pseudomonadota bacterium]